MVNRLARLLGGYRIGQGLVFVGHHQALDGHEQQRLVLAIAKAPGKNDGWIGRFRGAGSDFDPKIAHLLLHELQDRQNLLFLPADLLTASNAEE